MIPFIASITLVIRFLFFGTLFLFGIKYEGLESSSSYLIICVASAGLSIVLTAYELYFTHRNKSAKTLIPVWVLFVSVIVVLIPLGTAPSEAILIRNFGLYLIFGLPGLFIGAYVADSNKLSSIGKWMDVIMLTVSCGLMGIMPAVLISGGDDFGVGGATYQTTAYASGFCFGLNLCNILFGPDYEHFKIFKTAVFKYLSYILLIFQIVICLMSGGRGGFVLILVNAIILLVIARRFRRILVLSVVLGGLAIIVLNGLGKFGLKKVLDVQMERTFSYISSNGIDMHETSNRDLVYNYAWGQIKENPIFGSGIFRNEGFYPHNLILDFLYQGGIVYLMFWIIVLCRMFKRLARIIKTDKEAILLIPLATYPFIMLMFSGSYVDTSLFWFVVVYVFCYKGNLTAGALEQRNYQCN